MANNVNTSLKEKCRLSNFNSRKGIIHILSIPQNININKLRDEILKWYLILLLKELENRKKIISKLED